MDDRAAAEIAASAAVKAVKEFYEPVIERLKNEGAMIDKKRIFLEGRLTEREAEYRRQDNQIEKLFDSIDKLRDAAADFLSHIVNHPNELTKRKAYASALRTEIAAAIKATDDRIPF